MRGFLKMQIERKSMSTRDFVNMIGFHTYEQSFRTKIDNLDFVEISSIRHSNEYNVQLFDKNNRMIESKRIRKNSDTGLMIESRLFD